MSSLLPLVVSGVTTGTVYGLAGTGLVLTYRTSGIFNFAHGAVATAAAYFFYFLNVEHELDWKLSFVLSVVVLGPALGLVFEIFGRHLSDQVAAMKIVGTIGVILLVQGLATVRYGPDSLRVPQYLPGGRDTFELAGVRIGYDQLIITIVSLLAVVGLHALFHFTRTGVAMRAVVDNQELLSMHGSSPRRVRSVAWIIGTTFAAASGVLVAPLIGVEAIALTFLIVQAFGAAAIGGFTNIPLTYAGGIVIGIASALSKKWVIGVEWLNGLPVALPYIVLVLVLLVLPRHKLLTAGPVGRARRLPWRASARLRLGTGAVTLVVLAWVPSFAGSKLPLYTVGLTSAVMLLSLGLLVRTSGQVSLCNAAFGAVGAVAFAQLTLNFSFPWFLALLLGALIVVPFGLIVSIPSIRLSGLFLALATLGFGLMLERFAYPLGIMFTGTGGGRPMARPSIADGDHAYYYLVLAILVTVASLVALINATRLGRLLNGVSQAPLAMDVLGLRTTVTKTVVFSIAAFLAGLSGILYGSAVHFAVYSDVNYTSFRSLVLLALLALAPFREPWYALAAIAAVVLPAYIGGDDTTYWLNAMFGFFAIGTALQGGPPVMPEGLRRLLNRRKITAEVAARPATIPRGRVEASMATPGPGLEVENLTIRFSGLVALDGATLAAPTGAITGLIGPNGAGKTTMFNACSGIIRPTSGLVRFQGHDVTGLGPAPRGQRGLGRTFQITQLCDTLSVTENVRLGCEAAMAGSGVLSQIYARAPERRRISAQTNEALELCGITSLAPAQVGNLSTGQRRLVELARCVAGSFDVLMLDEPSSGLDRPETEQFAAILTSVVADRGLGILLVEHDMSLVLSACEQIYVLESGHMLMNGTPGEVTASAAVRAAYLGSDGGRDSEPAGADR